MEQRRAATTWIALFDRFVARWLFAFIALSALGLALLTVIAHGWVHLLLSLPGHLAAALAAGGIALLTRSPARRRDAVLCLLGVVAAAVPNLFGVGGDQWRGSLTAALLLLAFVPATRRTLSAAPVDAVVGGVQPTPEVATARSNGASQAPATQAHSFQRPVLVLNPRSGTVQAARGHLLETARRHGVQVREAPTPAGLVALTREAVADGADAVGVAGGDGSLAAAGSERRVDVATVGGRLFLNNASIGVYAALVHEPSYRDDRLGAIESVLEGVLEREALPVHASFRDSSGRDWDQVLVLFVSNNAYPLTRFGGRPRLDAGRLEVSGLLRLGRLLGRLGEREFGPGHDEHGGPLAPRQEMTPATQGAAR